MTAGGATNYSLRSLRQDYIYYVFWLSCDLDVIANMSMDDVMFYCSCFIDIFKIIYEDGQDRRTLRLLQNRNCKLKNGKQQTLWSLTTTALKCTVEAVNVQT